MVLYLRFDFYPRLPADPPSLVDIPITKKTRLCWFAQVIHREGRRGSGQPGVGGIGRHSQDLFFLIVDGLGDPQSREVDAGDGRLVELAQVRLVKDPPPRLLASRLSRHDDGIGLPTRIRLGKSKAVRELAPLSVPRRLTELLGKGAQGLVVGSVPHFACVQEAPCKAARIGEQRTLSCWVGVLGHGGTRRLVEALGVIVVLWRQIEHQTACRRETALAQVVNERVIVPGGPLERSCIGEPYIVLLGVLPPAVEDPVGVRLVEQIVQPQTEACASQSIGPDLGILTVASLPAGGPLPCQEVVDAAVRVGEGVGAIPNDGERSAPFVVPAHVAVQSQEQIEKPFVEEVPIGPNRVHLKSPRFDAIGGPPRDVVVALAISWDVQAVPGLWIGSALRVVANLRQPVDGSPVGPVAHQQLVEDGAIHLAPRWRGLGHQGHRIAGVEQVEAGKTQHRRSGFVVPHLRGMALAVPVVGRVGLAMQVFEPSSGALGEHWV
jgi:hypothetical protein